MLYDVVIVGGSFAGCAAALQLARTSRPVLLIDAGSPRNRFSKYSHGFLGLDGKSASEIQKCLQDELLSYGNIAIVRASVLSIIKLPAEEAFFASLSDGNNYLARKVILAVGVRDVLPPLAGLEERWGISVLHCPYCSEFGDGKPQIGVLARNEQSVHQAMLLSDWGPTVLFTQGEFTPTIDQVKILKTRGISIENTGIVEIIGISPHIDGVRLQDGRFMKISQIFLTPQTVPSTSLGQLLGCKMEERPTGPVILVDAQQRTSVPGVFAAGNITNPIFNATLSAATGSIAGSFAHRALLFYE